VGFRQKRIDQGAERAHRAWLEIHRDALVSCGLPLELYSSRISWNEFLSTGSAIINSAQARREFDFDELTLLQQQRLLALLESIVGMQDPPPGLLNYLRVRAAANWTPPYVAHSQTAGESPMSLAQCPCCDYFSLGSRAEYEICEICFWEDDGIDLDDLDRYSGPNHITLRDARDNFRRFSACDNRAVAHVLPEAKRVRFRRVLR